MPSNFYSTHPNFRVVMLTVGVVITAAMSCRKAASPTAPPTQVEASRTTASRSDDAPLSEPASELEGASVPVALSGTRGELGQQLYARHCAPCHGEAGDGRGIAAAFLFPKPRDLQAGKFRLVSTSNNVPMRDDLHAVLLRGMPGSSMPPWGHLSQVERDALVDEVMRIRQLGARAYYIRILKEEEELTDEEMTAEDVQQEIQEYVDGCTIPGETTVVPEMGQPTEEGISRGKETYARFGCLQCHGADGRGDGVQDMVDDDGYPTAPRDFTAGIFKGNADAASLYRRIAYGMPGTPMPSSHQMTSEQMVELVHFIRAMSTEEQRQAAVLQRERIVVKATGALPSLANEAAWSEFSAVRLRTTPLWWRNDADRDFRVQAAHDGAMIAMRLTWKDDRPDRNAARSETFDDAVAMELSRGNAEPFLGMGGPQAAVDVWFWNAERGHSQPVEALFPNTVVDVYPFNETVVASAEINRDGARTANQPDISLPARASGNQIVPTSAASGASSLTGGGPGTSTFRPAKSQLVRATGDWQDGRWTVVMVRPLALSSPEDGVPLRPGDTASVAFAIWDGAAQDRDGKKLITIWQDLILEN